MEFIGTMMIQGKVTVTDPCYDNGTWCAKTIECPSGEYYGYVEIKDEGDWGNRVSSISIFKDDRRCELSDMEVITSIGVDAGLAGFFYDKPDFKEDDKWIQFLIDSGVFIDENTGNSEKCFYAVPYGLFSESGYGDGEYDVYANEDRTAFTIVFIPDEEDEEEEWC